MVLSKYRSFKVIVPCREADKVVSTEEAKPEEDAAPAEEPVAEEAAPPQGEEEKVCFFTLF